MSEVVDSLKIKENNLGLKQAKIKYFYSYIEKRYCTEMSTVSHVNH